jgi:3-dehydroquinate synthase II
VVIDVTGAANPERLLREAKGSGIRKAISRGVSPEIPRVDGVQLFRVSDAAGSDTAAWVEVSGAKDMERAVAASGEGHAFVVIQPENWKIIPLENLIADFHRSEKKVYAYMKTKAEMEMAFSILEKGVDGIVVPAEALQTAAEIASALGREDIYSLPVAKVTKIVDVGNGERACIDTASQLTIGEGLLIGSRASFFFLVHSETVPSEYIPTREFRVNAGAIHSYVLGEDDKTRYLSELRSSDKVRTVMSDGRSRQVIVGRVKIERRPLMMIEASAGGELGTVMVQKAETIRLIRPDGSPVSVTDIKVGDEVLVHLTQSKARHFGGEVDEFILER